MRAACLAIALVLIGCGDDSPQPDASTAGSYDASAMPDTGTPDAPGATVCGQVSCDPAIQLCVIRGPVGPGYTYACEAVPAGCETDRTCACVAATLCTGAFDTCLEGDAGNTVTCECPACQ